MTTTYFLYGVGFGSITASLLTRLWFLHLRTPYRRWRAGICGNFIRGPARYHDDARLGWTYTCRTCGHDVEQHAERTYARVS